MSMTGGNLWRSQVASVMLPPRVSRSTIPVRGKQQMVVGRTVRMRLGRRNLLWWNVTRSSWVVAVHADEV